MRTSHVNPRQALYNWYCPLLQRLTPPHARVLELEGYLKLEGASHPAERLRGSISHYVSADLAEAPQPLLALPQHDYLRADCRRLPFPSHCFDLVHVTFPSRADSFISRDRPTPTTFGLSHMASSVAGVARVLKPAGCFVLFPFWTGDEVWEEALRRAFSQHGFRLTVEGPYGGLFVAIFHRFPGLTKATPRVVSLRLNDAIYDRLVRKAARQGMSVGEWLTRLVEREGRSGWRWLRF